MMYGYARVSSDTQDHAGQVEALKTAGCEQIFAEKQTGKTAADRKQLQVLLAKAQPGDVIVVTKLDRFARSTRDLLNMLHDLEQSGVGFRSLGDAIDTTSPAGRLMLQMLAAIAEFERGMIRERCNAGLARAKSEGRQLGRKPALDPHQRQRVRELLDAGETQRSVARLLGVGQATIARIAEAPA
jgi:DNA invertase Pin-like site-specific DNA recombinase